MLAERDPTHYPVVVMAEQDRMLLADFGVHRPLGSDVALSQWEDILHFYAQLQVSSVGSIPQWLSLRFVTDTRRSFGLRLGMPAK